MQYTATQTTRDSWIERLFGLPLFYKVLIANSVIVVMGAIFGTALTLRTTGRTDTLFDLVALFAILGTLTSILVNWVVLRAALRPLIVLEQTVDEVRQGNFSVRAAKVGLSDPNIDALTDTFNAMLDAVERYREQLHDMSIRVLNAQEEERKRISRELHDGTAQALTAQLLRLKTIEATGRRLDDAGLTQLIELTAETLEEVRHLAHELRPPSLDDLGLQASLEGLAAQYRDRFGLPVRFQGHRLKRLAPDLELAIYRIVQEALTNVAKHAEARQAIVTLRVEPPNLHVEIADDGHGFDLSRLDRRARTGLGLFGMQERATLIDGAFNLSSRPGKGTVVHLTAPLDNVVASPPTEVLQA